MQPENTVTRQIHSGSEKGGKQYAFDEAHDETTLAQMWFQNSDEGLILFVVFYTQACRWSRCLGCNLPSKMSAHHVPFGSIMAQIDHLFSDPEVIGKAFEIQKLIISNNGSILDEDTFSSTALIYLLARVNQGFPNLKVLAMETRPEYVDTAELEFLSRALAEGTTPTQLELAIGFEAFDDKVRNDIFDKGLTLESFERFLKTISPFKYRLKCYFMQKPIPGMSDAAAVEDIQAGIDYLAGVAEKYDVDINMHLNPTYAATGTRLADAFADGTFTPPKLSDVRRAVQHGRGKHLSIFVGLSDEGLAVPGGSFIREGDAPLIDALELFNRTQDYSVLDI